MGKHTPIPINVERALETLYLKGDVIYRKSTNEPIKQRKSVHGYIRVVFDSMETTYHRLLWALYYRTNPEQSIDHINGIRDDNRIENLRMATNRINMQNLPIHRETDKKPGVFKTKSGYWRVLVGINGTSICLGQFQNQTEACEAYKIATTNEHLFDECGKNKNKFIKLLAAKYCMPLSIKRGETVVYYGNKEIQQKNSKWYTKVKVSTNKNKIVVGPYATMEAAIQANAIIHANPHLCTGTSKEYIDKLIRLGGMLHPTLSSRCYYKKEHDNTYRLTLFIEKCSRCIGSYESEKDVIEQQKLAIDLMQETGDIYHRFYPAWIMQYTGYKNRKMK